MRDPTLSVLARLRVVVAPTKRMDVLKTLRCFMGPTQFERGCISCHLYQDVDNENILTYVERWERKEDMDRHIRSDRYRKLVAVIDESVEPPDIRFDTIAETQGIAAIWAARDSSAIQ